MQNNDITHILMDIQIFWVVVVEFQNIECVIQNQRPFLCKSCHYWHFVINFFTYSQVQNWPLKVSSLKMRRLERSKV